MILKDATIFGQSGGTLLGGGEAGDEAVVGVSSLRSMGNSRMYQALAAYGDRLSQVGLFSFKVSRTGVITESGVAISNMLTYINRWPHIKWLLTISNDGTNSIFAALRDNTDGAQDTFLSEIVRIMEKYPWCDGIDIDLEKGDGYSTHEKGYAV